MGFVVTMFVSVVMAVFGIVFSGSADAKTVTKNGAVYSCDYNCANTQNLVKTNVDTCCPGSLPPGFRNRQQPEVMPAGVMPPMPVLESPLGDLKNALGGLFGLIVGVVAAVGGGFSGYRQEKAKDELIAETEAAKEKAFVESHSAKLAAAKSAALAK